MNDDTVFLKFFPTVSRDSGTSAAVVYAVIFAYWSMNPQNPICTASNSRIASRTGDLSPRTVRRLRHQLILDGWISDLNLRPIKSGDEITFEQIVPGLTGRIIPGRRSQQLLSNLWITQPPPGQNDPPPGQNDPPPPDKMSGDPGQNDRQIDHEIDTSNNDEYDEDIYHTIKENLFFIPENVPATNSTHERIIDAVRAIEQTFGDDFDPRDIDFAIRYSNTVRQRSDGTPLNLPRQPEKIIALIEEALRRGEKIGIQRRPPDYSDIIIN